MTSFQTTTFHVDFGQVLVYTQIYYAYLWFITKILRRRQTNGIADSLGYWRSGADVWYASQIFNGKLTRKEAIHQVSEKLRRWAINKGIEIDDIFRNENGITFQMSALEVAYTGIKTKLKQPTKLFVETVNLYRNHKEFVIVQSQAKFHKTGGKCLHF